jgi:diguanylate cyclase (GGDEF)-like protein/PAS domain S-box-containing protein
MAGINLASSSSDADRQLTRALSAVVRSRVRRFLPVVAIVYLLYSLENVGPGGAGTFPVWPAFLSVMCGAVVWLNTRENAISDQCVEPSVFMILMLVLITCLGELNAATNTAQLPVLLLLVMAAGGTLLTQAWFAGFMATAMLGWTCVSVRTLPPKTAAFSALAIFITGAFSCIVFRARLHSQCEVQKARLEAENLKAQEQENQQRTELAIEGSRDGLWYWDLKAGVFNFSPGWAALLGYEPGELETNVDEWFSRVHPGYIAELQTVIADHLAGTTDRFHHEHRLRSKDGTYIWVTARGAAARGPDGKPVAIAGAHADVSSIMALESRVLDDTFHDNLTSLPNRQFFLKHLELALERDQRPGKSSGLFGVMFLDLDRFKVINDSLGHLIGDQLLVAVAGRLRNCARQQDIIARFGGDEFVVLLNPLRDVNDAMAVAGRFRRALSEPFHIGGKEVASGATIGIVLSNQNATRPEDYLRYADMAMYHAKAHSKGDIQLFNEEMTANATELCDLQNDLARALHRQELLLHYQPLVSIGSGKICGAEALIRWKRADGRVLLPGQFISVAEEMGLIGDIGEWALRTACAQNSAWQRAGLPPMRVAVNLSAKQLQHSNFSARVVKILEETRLSSRWLELELTETALMDTLELAPAALDQLTKQGIRIAIDDFGTGYSSMNYLRRYNFHALKMDRCFVSDIVSDKRTGAIAKGLISLAHNLDLSVVAEGVEHQDQLNFLRAENCDAVQGYLASTPVPPEAFTQLLQAGSVGKKLLQDAPDAAWATQQSELELAAMMQEIQASGSPGTEHPVLG